MMNIKKKQIIASVICLITLGFMEVQVKRYLFPDQPERCFFRSQLIPPTNMNPLIGTDKPMMPSEVYKIPGPIPHIPNDPPTPIPVIEEE